MTTFLKTTAKNFFLIGGIIFGFSHSAQSRTIGFSVGQSSTSETQVSVLDDDTLQAIPDAMVTIQSEFEISEFVLFSDATGTARFLPVPESALLANSQKTITVSKAGYAFTKVIGVQNSHITIFLKPLDNMRSFATVHGSVSGWERDDELLSKPVYMGLVFRSMSAYDLLDFNVKMLVSPLKDEIDIWGKRKIPSNLVIPNQDIPILLGSIHVNKPDYRLPVPPQQDSQLAIVQAQINSSDLIDIGQSGKVEPTSLNKIHFDRLGISKTFTPTGEADLQLDLRADLPLKDTHQVKVNAPPFVSDVLVAAISDISENWSSLLLTDVKAPLTINAFENHGPLQLRSAPTLAARDRMLLTIAISQDLKRISGIITTNAGTQVNPGEYLNSEASRDSASMPEQLKIRAPETGIGGAVFRATDEERHQTFPIGYVFTLPSAGETLISTRNLPFQQKVSQYAVVQLEFGKGFNEKDMDGRNIITQLKRFATERAEIKTERP